MEYEDILYLNHYELKYHPKMDLYSRSAQFAPFQALVGYEKLIEEKGKRKEIEKNVGEFEEEKINNCLQALLEYEKKDILVEIIYYSKKEKTTKKITDIYKKIDIVNHSIILKKTTIPLIQIKDIKIL